MPQEINYGWRSFVRAVEMTIAATQFGISGSAAAQSTKTKPVGVPPIKPGTNKSFGSLKQIDGGLLNVGYAEGGYQRFLVILLHRWPYGIHNFIDLAPILPSASYRVIVPYVRGGKETV